MVANPAAAKTLLDVVVIEKTPLNNLRDPSPAAWEPDPLDATALVWGLEIE